MSPVTRQLAKRIVAATLPTLVAFGLQAAFWHELSPFAWVLFYPAVLASSWCGGRVSGVVAAVISTCIALYYFVPPEQTFEVDARYIPATVIFAATSLAIIWFHERLRRAHRAANLAADERRIFMALVESSSDFIGIADPSGKPVYLNPAGRRMIGLTPDFPVDRLRIQDCYPKELVPFVHDILETTVERGQWSGETFFRHQQTDAAIPVSDDHFMIRDAKGDRILGMGTVARDISEARRVTEKLRESEEALQTSEREFRMLAESMPQMVWATTAEGLNTYFNQRWVDYTGLTMEESSGEGWIIPFHPDDRQRAWDAWKRAIHHHDVYSVECRLRRADGVYQWWLIRGLPLVGANGEILKWFGTCTDIEHIKIAERKLTRLEKEQRFLADAGAMLSASLDYEQTLASVARLVVRDFADWCIVDITGDDQTRRLKVVSGDPSKADVCAALEQVANRDRPDLLRVVIETRQPLLIEHVTPEQVESVSHGPEHLQALRAATPTSVMALPLLRHGQLFGVLTFVSSGPRRYGPSDLRLAEALADRAAVAIENARLYNASVEAAQIRDQVLGVVAHDLRNPLSAIKLQAGLLQRRDKPERRSRKPAETIQRAATRMNRLIEDILDVSRVEGGHLSVDQTRVPTRQIVSDAVEAQAPLASSASIDLRLDVETGVSDVWADRDRVVQVFENLIGNAVKFTPPGGRITAGAALHGREVVFWVKDTGAGIPAEEIPRVFDRFWQARKARRAGAGLGLQIVKGIVEAHHGRIWVESEVGVGTTFYFTLPTARAATAHQPAA